MTQSLLTQFMFCRERCRIGLQGWTQRSSNLGLSFGNVMHGACEQMYRDVQHQVLSGVPDAEYLVAMLLRTEEAWRRDNPLADANDTQYLEQALMLASGVLPAYCARYAEDFTKTRWLDLEHQFCLLRKIEGIGVVPIKGKLDGVWMVGDRPGLLETKTKGRIDESAIAEVLPIDLQVNLYLMALRKWHKVLPIGVTYNVIRRPQLKQKSGETFEQFATRVAADVQTRLDWYFVRMEMTVEDADLDRFEGELDDLIRDFVSWWEGRVGHYKHTANCAPSSGWSCDALPICAHRDFSMFFKRPTVFRELEEQ